MFLVPKKKGTYCPVIDLNRLNKVFREPPFLDGEHFFLRRGEFITCIDLKNAYLSVHVHVSSQRYLCFQWRNRFGLNTAPRVFTKLTKPMTADLQKRGIPIIDYLKDFLILASSIDESKANT